MQICQYLFRGFSTSWFHHSTSLLWVYQLLKMYVHPPPSLTPITCRDSKSLPSRDVGKKSFFHDRPLSWKSKIAAIIVFGGIGSCQEWKAMAWAGLLKMWRFRPKSRHPSPSCRIIVLEYEGYFQENKDVWCSAILCTSSYCLNAGDIIQQVGMLLNSITDSQCFILVVLVPSSRFYFCVWSQPFYLLQWMKTLFNQFMKPPDILWLLRSAIACRNLACIPKWAGLGGCNNGGLLAIGCWLTRTHHWSRPRCTRRLRESSSGPLMLFVSTVISVLVNSRTPHTTDGTFVLELFELQDGSLKFTETRVLIALCLLVISARGPYRIYHVTLFADITDIDRSASCQRSVFRWYVLFDVVETETVLGVVSEHAVLFTGPLLDLLYRLRGNVEHGQWCSKTRWVVHVHVLCRVCEICIIISIINLINK